MRILVFVPSPIRHPRTSANRVYLRPLRLFLDLRKMFRRNPNRSLNRFLNFPFTTCQPQLFTTRVTIPCDFSRNCPLSLPLFFMDHFTLHLTRLDPISPRWLHASAYIRAHGDAFHLYTEGHTGIYAYENTYAHIHTDTDRHRYTSGHATDGLTARTARMTRCAPQRRPATQRRRCMHLPKAVRDEGGVGGGALYRVENARTGFGPVAPTNRYSGLR